MREVLQGVKVVEVASWTFVPAAGAVLADWGADVLKIEHPVTGDPQRGLISSGLVPAGAGRDQLHHGAAQPRQAEHRTQPLDRRGPRAPLSAGRDAPTSSSPTSCRTCANADDRRRAHPGRATPTSSTSGAPGRACEGPDADKGGYDGASYWARGGLADGADARRARVADQPAPGVRRRDGRHDDRRGNCGRAVPP